MPGDFVYVDMTRDLKAHSLALSHSRWLETLHHADVRWDAGEVVLRNVLNGMALPEGNRQPLPPHKYLEFFPNPTLYIDGHILSSWRQLARGLIRPQMGLKILCTAASNHWLAGRKAEALIEQIKHGTVSIEIYYLDGQRMEHNTR